MQLRNIRPHSQYRPGDLVEVPDGDAFDGFCWEAVPPGNCAAIIAELAADPQPEPDLPAAPAAQFPPAPKEM